MKRVTLLFLLFFICFGVHAQSTVRFATYLAKPGQPAPIECTTAKAVLSKTLLLYPHPDKWTYIIACDDSAWKDLMSRMDKRHGEHYGETDFAPDAQITYLRGSTLLGLDDSLARGLAVISPDHLVAHELCHIYLHSRDEDKVDRLALTWIRDAHTVPPNLIAKNQ
jgi:hypothetical protein